ncbi:MAG: VCBS domain-containing protein, partial [Gemmataceae bacterium]|nr:VCBS domain-containing protein [Gemmataceae bacterium]
TFPNPSSAAGTNTYVVTVRATDNGIPAASSTQTISVTILHRNHAPVATLDAVSITVGTASVSGNVLSNDTDQDTWMGDSMSVVGVATGYQFTLSGGVGVGSALNGTYGTLTVAANGAYTYVLNNSNSAVQGLAAGSTLNDVFTYTIQDQSGSPSTTQVFVTISR